MEGTPKVICSTGFIDCKQFVAVVTKAINNSYFLEQ